MRVLVTGGAGFIGSHLVDRLLADAHDVTCVDNLDDYYAPRLKRYNLLRALRSVRFHWVWGDVGDRDFMETLSRRQDVVVHLAARPGARRSIEEPERYAEVNVTGTINVLEASRSAGVDRVVVASSSAVYGVSPDVPFCEDTSRLVPASPYGASKLAAEQFCQVFHRLHGVPVTCLRFFTVYGPRQRPDMAIYQFVTRIAQRRPITVFGDGRSQRDYTHVDDVIDGVVQAIAQPRGFQIYNLGTSKTVSLADLIGTIQRVLGRRAILDEQPDQPGDAPITFANIDRASRDLGYRPRIGLEEGIDRFVAWFRAEQAAPDPALALGASPS
jgi:UDP-glucuronate 4-epimerase